MKYFYFFATAILSLAISSCSDDSEKIPEHKVSIEAPFKSLTVNENTFTINPAKGKTLRLKDGTSLDIPANAFVDKNGNPVTAPVTITYKEFDNPAEIITSGIPMSCEDSAGKVRNFESGGMFELRGTAGGQEVAIAQGKNIGVNMATNLEGEYDFFFLKEVPGEQQSTASLFPSANAQTTAANKKYYWKKIDLKKDTTQSKKEEKLLFSNDPKAPRFKIKFDSKQNPDIEPLNAINWQYAGTINQENPLAAENNFVLTANWTDLDISQPMYKVVPKKSFQLKKENDKDLLSIWHFSTLFNQSNNIYLFENGDNSIVIADWKGSILGNISKQKLSGSNFGFFENFPRFFDCRYKDYFVTENPEATYSDRTYSIYDFSGKKQCSIDQAHDLKLLEKTKRIVYETREDDHLVISSLNGTLIKEFKLDEFKGDFSFMAFSRHQNYTINEQQTTIALLAEGNIIITDMNGKTIASTPLEKTYSGISISPSKNILFIEDGAKLIAWDWEKNKMTTTEIPGKKLSINSGSGFDFIVLSITYAHPSLPLVIVSEQRDYSVQNPSSTNYLWNYETNTLSAIGKPVTGEYGDCYFLVNGNFICSHANKETNIYDTNLKLLKSIKEPRSLFPIASKDQSMLILNGETNLIMLDKGGKIVIDFKQYDSLSNFAMFTPDGNIICSSTDGHVYLWNTSGKLLKKVLTPDNRNMKAVVPIKGDDKFYTYHETYYHIWDYNGNLLHTINNSAAPFATSTTDGNTLLSAEKISDKSAERLNLYDLFQTKIDKGIWQLVLLNKKNSYTTYVRLTEADHKTITTFIKKQKDLLDKEKKRAKQEEEVIRSFQVAEFGIYNWDKFYSESDAQKIAVTLDIDTSNTAYSNYTIFHITGQNLTAVIKYKSDNLKDFRFKTTDRNMIMVVLPGDRIGLLDEKSFKEATANVKADQPVTFKLKILNKAASTEELNKLLNNKPPA